MPKIDSVTGCSVMTLPEFLNAEGEREGKTGAEILGEIMYSMEEDDARQRAQYQDPVNALGFILPYAKMDFECWLSDKESHNENNKRFRDDFKGEWLFLHRNCRESYKDAAEYRAKMREIYILQGYDKPHETVKPPFPLQVIRVLDASSHQRFRSSTSGIKALCYCDDFKYRIATLSCSHYDGSRMEPPDEDSNLEWSEPVEYNFYAETSLSDGAGI